MSTWHQQKAGIPLYHPTKWSVVTDPPHQCTTVMLFDTQAAAVTFLDNLKARGKADHTYILSPSGEAPCT